MKTEVYSWRVSAELKTMLRREARRRNISVFALLDRAVQDLLAGDGTRVDDEQEQRRFRKSALPCVGDFAGGDPDRSVKARQILRQRAIHGPQVPARTGLMQATCTR